MKVIVVSSGYMKSAVSHNTRIPEFFYVFLIVPKNDKKLSVPYTKNP